MKSRRSIGLVLGLLVGLTLWQHAALAQTASSVSTSASAANRNDGSKCARWEPSAASMRASAYSLTSADGVQ